MVVDTYTEVFVVETVQGKGVNKRQHNPNMTIITTTLSTFSKIGKCQNFKTPNKFCVKAIVHCLSSFKSSKVSH